MRVKKIQDFFPLPLSLSFNFFLSFIIPFLYFSCFLLSFLSLLSFFLTSSIIIIIPSSLAFLARNQPPILDHWWTLKENCPLNVLLQATPIASCSASYRPQGHAADPKQRMVFSLAGSSFCYRFLWLKQTNESSKKKKNHASNGLIHFCTAS